MLNLGRIEAAAARIGDSIYESPLVYSEALSGLTGNAIYLKLENLQMTGSFKERGALNRIHIVGGTPQGLNWASLNAVSVPLNPSVASSADLLR